MIYFLLYFVLANIYAFFLMWKDKKNAQAEGKRTSEAKLLFGALIFGFIGTVIGMYALRHKISKRKFLFQASFVLIVFYEIFILYLLNDKYDLMSKI